MKLQFATIACLLCVLPFLACWGNDKAPKDGPGRASLLPIVTVKGTSDFTVPVAFTNPSDGIVRYPFARGGWVWSRASFTRMGNWWKKVWSSIPGHR